MSRGKLPRFLQNLLLMLVATLGAAWLGDHYISYKGLDRLRMARSLYYQNAYIPVHQISDDPMLHYELKPGATWESDGQYGPFSIHIGSQGARGVDYPVKKAPGVFRILCFGPSTTFGADVSDDESIPAQLEKYLREKLALTAGAAAGAASATGDAGSGPADARGSGSGSIRSLEVWNFGTSAYVPIQTAWLAMKKLTQLQPDLIAMVFNNGGRRAFLNVPGALELDYLHWFRADPSLWDENFPAPRGRSRAWHRRLLSWSAFYRYVIAQQILERKIEIGPMQGGPQGVRLSAKLVEKARAAGVPVMVVSWFGENGRNYPGVPDNYHISVFDRPDHGVDPHPPADTLKMMAVRIGEEMIRRGIMPMPAGSSSH